MFHDFVFEVNTQHVSFQKAMIKVIEKEDTRATGKKRGVKNPVLVRMVDHFKNMQAYGGTPTDHHNLKLVNSVSIP